MITNGRILFGLLFWIMVVWLAGCRPDDHLTTAPLAATRIARPTMTPTRLELSVSSPTATERVIDTETPTATATPVATGVIISTTPTAEPTLTPTRIISGSWQVVTSSYYQYSFEVPAGWFEPYRLTADMVTFFSVPVDENSLYGLSGPFMKLDFSVIPPGNFATEGQQPEEGRPVLEGYTEIAIANRPAWTRLLSSDEQEGGAFPADTLSMYVQGREYWYQFFLACSPEWTAECSQVWEHIWATFQTAGSQHSVYRNEPYGFTFRYPSDWLVIESPNGIVLVSAGGSLRIQFKFVGEDVEIGRTGVAAGDLVNEGDIIFLGESISREVLVYQGREKAVLYEAGDEIQRGNVIFTISLGSNRPDYESIDIPEYVQLEAAWIIQSFDSAN